MVYILYDYMFLSAWDRWSEVNRIKRDAAQVLSFKTWARKHNDSGSGAMMWCCCYTHCKPHTHPSVYVYYLTFTSGAGGRTVVQLQAMMLPNERPHVESAFRRLKVWNFWMFLMRDHLVSTRRTQDNFQLCLQWPKLNIFHGKPSFWQQNWVFFKEASGYFWSFLWQLKTGISSQDGFLCLNLNRASPQQYEKKRNRWFNLMNSKL